MAEAPCSSETLQGRECELSSPQNKLKDILHTIFKRNDQQVAGDVLTAQNCQEHEPTASAAPDAVPATADAAASPTGACAEVSPRQQDEQLMYGNHKQRDCSAALDADGGPATIALAAAAATTAEYGVAVPLEQQAQLEVSSTTATAGATPATQLHHAPATAHEAWDRQPTVLGQPQAHACVSPSAGRTIMAVASPAQHEHSGPQEPSPLQSDLQTTTVLQESSNILPAAAVGQEQSAPAQHGCPTSQALPSTAAPAAHLGASMASEPGHSSSKTAAQRKMLCASVDDLYQELFGDVPLPSTSACSSAAQSPYSAALVRGVSSMSPMTTSSAFCHQQAAAAAIAGSGGMPGMGLIPVGPSMPYCGNSNSLCSSYDGTCSNYGYTADSTCGEYAASSIVTQAAAQTPGADDMLPAGACPPRVRVHQPSRFSGSDGGSSSLFPEESPSYCSSSAGGQAWPVVSTDEPSAGVSDLSSAHGWGSRGSLRYSSPHEHSSAAGAGREAGVSPQAASRLQAAQGTDTKQQPGVLSAPGSAEGSKPGPRSSLRTRWSNWINGGGSSSGGSSPGRRSSGQQLTLQQEDQEGQQQQRGGLANGATSAPWLSHGKPSSPKISSLAAHSAPGNAAAQALYNSTGGTASRAGADLPLHQLVHCHSNPELVQAAALGSVGHGRPHYQRSSGLGGGGGGGGPPCARALFGSMPQMEGPLMAAHSLGNSSSNNSSGWLSGPGGVSFGAPARSESFGVLAALTACDDALSVASDDEVIRQVNADNVLSSTWGPGSHSTAGGAAAAAGCGQPAGPASHPKLLAFKYCCATSPLNHPGRASPFGSARNSPFNSPRGTRDTGVVDLLPLRSSIAAAAAAAAASSCPGSPLGPRQSNPFSSSNSTPAAGAAAAAEDGDSRAGDTAAMQAGSAGIAEQQGQQQEDHEAERLADGAHTSTQHSAKLNNLVLKKQPSTSSSIDQAPPGDGMAGADPCYSCNSSSGGGSTTSSSKPPLQSRPMKGSLRTPPPPLPLPVPQVPAAAQSPHLMAASPMQQHRCLTLEAAGSAGSSSGGGCSWGGSSHQQLSRSSTGPTGSQSATATGGGGYARRISAPAGLSALVMRFSSNSGSSSSSSTNPAPSGGGSSIGGRSSQDSLMKTPAAAGAAGSTDSQTLSDSELLCAAAGSSHSSSGRAVGVPPPLPSCSIDVGSPRQLQPAAADSRSSPRRQSSSRLGASCGFTTPSRLSHNTTMGEALLAASAGGGPVSGGGGFALQRTSSCCSSSGGWVGGGGGSGSCSRPGGRSSNGYLANATPGRDSLLSTASVPLTHAYGRDTAGVNCSDSSDGSWTAGAAARRTADTQQQEQQQQGSAWPVATDSSGLVANMTARTAASGAANRYGSCDGASEVSTDCQGCPYPSWCSSSCLSPLAPPQQQQQVQIQVPATQQQQQQQQQVQRGSRQQQLASASSVGEAADGTTDVSAAALNAGAAVADSAAHPSLPEVDFLEKIGRGSFGDVFKGVWCGSVVAIKVIQVKQPTALTFPNRPSTNQQQRRTNDEQTSQQGLRSHPLGDAAAAHGATSDYDSQAAQVALELAQHEYESWLNANLRHPNIVQLFTSFTLGLEERSPMAMPSLLLGSAGGDDDASSPRSGFPLMQDARSSGLSWKTHLVMEFCELGTMQDLLQRGVFSQGLHGAAACPSSSHLSWVLATAKEFCTAVSYLHSMDVVHGDLKSSNVLLKAAALTSWDTRGFVAKVSDFGLSRVMDAISAANGEPPSTPPATSLPSAAATCNAGHTGTGTASAGAPGAGAAGACSSSSSSTGGGGGGGEGGGHMPSAGGGSLGWQPCQHRFGALSHAAPELIRGAQLSKASDVYSIGVLLWELLTGQAPFYGMHPGQLLSLKLSQHTSQLLPFPPSTPHGLAQLCLECWTVEPLERPSMVAVVQRINDLAVTLLGQEQAVAMFPDVAASLAAQRRQAAAAALNSSGFGASCN